MPLLTLYREEMKAAMRGRFAWLGAGVLLLVVGGVATVGTQDTWPDGLQADIIGGTFLCR